MRMFRGTDGETRDGGARWFAADRDYAAFFGARIEMAEVETADLLDLRHLGLGHDVSDDDLPAGTPRYRGPELYLWAERADVQDALREQGYRGVRLMQWHLDYGEGEQDTTLVID